MPFSLLLFQACCVKDIGESAFVLLINTRCFIKKWHPFFSLLGQITFNVVRYDVLGAKLAQLKLPPSVLQWIISFLNGKTYMKFLLVVTEEILIQNISTKCGC